MKTYLKILIVMELVAMLITGLVNMIFVDEFDRNIYGGILAIVFVCTSLSAFIMTIIEKWISGD